MWENMHTKTCREIQVWGHHVGGFSGGRETGQSRYEQRRKYLPPNFCQSRFSGVYLVFEVVQERGFKERLAIPVLVLQACISFLQRRRKKAYTAATERKSFGELFWPQRKTFQAGGRYKNPQEPRRTISTTEIFPLWPPFFFSAKKSS